MRPTRRWWAVLLTVPLLIMTACTAGGSASSGGGNQQAATATKNLHFAVVTHATSGDPFWEIVKSGVEKAEKKYGVEVTYHGSGQPLKQAQMVRTAIDKNVDGLVVSMAAPDALKGAVNDAVQADIPVIVINAGIDAWQDVGAMTYIGQTNFGAGKGAGSKLAEAGVQHLVCVIHEAGNVSLAQRCKGANAGFDGQQTKLQVDINNLAEATSRIEAKLASDQSIDGILTLNPAVAIAARDAIRNAGLQDKVTLATFDLSGDVIEAIQEGQILFAVDQQPYLQGYLPVSFLWLYNHNLNTVGGGQPVLTGPGFVTQENADKVAKYAERGTR